MDRPGREKSHTHTRAGWVASLFLLAPRWLPSSKVRRRRTGSAGCFAGRGRESGGVHRCLHAAIPPAALEVRDHCVVRCHLSVRGLGRMRVGPQLGGQCRATRRRSPWWRVSPSPPREGRCRVCMRMRATARCAGVCGGGAAGLRSLTPPRARRLQFYCSVAACGLPPLPASVHATPRIVCRCCRGGASGCTEHGSRHRAALCVAGGSGPRALACYRGARLTAAAMLCASGVSKSRAPASGFAKLHLASCLRTLRYAPLAARQWGTGATLRQPLRGGRPRKSVPPTAMRGARSALPRRDMAHATPSLAGSSGVASRPVQFRIVIACRHAWAMQRGDGRLPDVSTPAISMGETAD
jgi:hypothetical protein